MTPTLDQISVNPDNLRVFFTEQHLSEQFVEVSSINFDYPVNDDNSFLWGHLTSFMASRGGLYSYKLNNPDLFYAVVLPEFSKSEVKQLNTVLEFVDRLFNAEGDFVNTGSFLFSIMKPSVTLKTDHFSILRKGTHNFIFSTKHMTIDLKSLSFESVYFAVLADFKTKIEGYINQQDVDINTAVFNSIIDESVPLFVERIFLGSVVKPVSNKVFRESFDENTKDIIQKDFFKFLEPHDDLYAHRGEVPSDGSTHAYAIKVGLENMKVFKNILKHSMKPKDINLLINILSMTAFHYNIMNPSDKYGYLTFLRYDVMNLNKVAIAKKDFFYEFQVGDYSFTFGKDMSINPIHSDRSIITNTIDELYHKQFEFIIDDICSVLTADKEDVTVLDLQVIDMIVF